VLNDRMINDMEGSSHDLMGGTILAFVLSDRKTMKPLIRIVSV
jgi:hypothetical protein